MSVPHHSDQMVSKDDAGVSKGIAFPRDTSVTEHPLFKIATTFSPVTSYFFYILHRYFKKYPSLYTRPAIIIMAVGIFLRYARHTVNGYLLNLVQQHFMSRADIREGDEIFNIVMSWVNRQRFSKNSRFFQVATDVLHDSWGVAGLAPWEKKKINEESLKYSPAFGSYRFWHKGRLFFFKRSVETEGSVRCEELSISTLGRSPTAIKTFLEQCKEGYIEQDEENTLIYRADDVGNVSRCSWKHCLTRTSRPFSTIVLDSEVKNSLIQDLTEYLSDKQQRWYNNRGIPYRRGYLLHGPPGTGKTSLSFAIAGLFNLRLYSLSLSSEMDDSTLANLFGQLPPRCILLLEDIDSCQLTHQRMEDDTAEKSVKGKVSLSGLLNVLDGVASQEGRLLIMTTNHIEKLDAALIRPGRVDMSIKFTLAKKAQLIQIFRSIYEIQEGDALPAAIRTCTNSSSSKADDIITPIDEKGGKEKTATAEAAEGEHRAKILELASKFAASIPDEEFSPAEIQGYLLRWKRNPEMAVQEVTEWVRETKASKSAERQTELAIKKATESLQGVDERIQRLRTEKAEQDEGSEIETRKLKFLLRTVDALSTTPISKGVLEKAKLAVASDETKIFEEQVKDRVAALEINSSTTEITDAVKQVRIVLAAEEAKIKNEKLDRQWKYDGDLQKADEERKKLGKELLNIKKTPRKSKTI